MNIVMCKECGMSYQDGRKSGDYYCPTCQKITKFYKLEAFCGAKPGELYKHE
jgi:uncharacterized Zn finger protein (UPF0148 family)